MTTLNPPPTVAPVEIDLSPVTFRGHSDVQPFTYRVGMSYTAVLESMRKWLLVTLVPYLNSNFEDVTDAWVTNVTEISQAIDKSLADQADTVNAALAQAIDDLTNGSIAVTDPAVLAVLQASSSQTRNYFDGRYALKGAGIADGYDIVILAGQSNMSGRGTPYGATTDPVNPSIFQYNSSGANAGTIQPATEPLSMHDTPSGIGPGLQFARWYASRRLASNRKVLLIPVAHGGTPLSSNVSPLGWRPGVSGNLYANMISRAQGALTAANVQYTATGANRVVAVLWHQGETDGDNGITADAYRADLDTLIADVRNDLGIAGLPFVVGTLVPEYLTSGSRYQIDAALRDTPNRVTGVDVAVGPAGSNMGDGNHYNAAGQRLLGRAYYDAFERIVEGVAPVQTPRPVSLGPVATLTVSAADGHSITVTYPTVTGATGYLVEFRETGTTTWQTAFTTTNPTTYVLGGLFPSTRYDIRVTPVNASGNGYPATISANTQIATTLISDTFTRADTASGLGTADTGNAWTAITGTFGISSNQAYHGAAQPNPVVAINSGQADCIVQATFAALSTTAGAIERLVFRSDGTASNYWALQYRQSTNTYQLYKWVGGVITQVGTDLPAVPKPGDVVAVSMTASAIEVRINGVTQLYAVDSDNKTNTYHGLGGNNTATNSRFDNFTVSR